MSHTFPTTLHRFSTALPGALWAGAWTAANLWWLSRDLLLRDGDEEGHVGAAELFMVDLADGHWLGWLERLWVGDMGDYPSLYPALTGAWWWLWGGGDPARVAVRALGLLWVLIAAGAAGALARRAAVPGAGLLAFVSATLLPLPVGLGRHFMPEGMLVAATALAVLAAQRAGEHPTAGRGLALGLAVGAGLLVKQTFLLVAVPGVLAALLLARPGRAALRALLPASGAVLLVAGPWYGSQAARQLAYGAESAAHMGQGELLAHLAWYPVAAGLVVVGPALGLMALGGLLLGWRDGRRAPLHLALAWALGATLLLTVVPKKYPRLLAPVAPAAAVLIGAGLAGRRRTALGGAVVLAAGGGWLLLRSTSPPLDLPRALQQVVPGCPQHWLRPPVPDDLGMAAVAAALDAAGPGPVRVLRGPELSCALQTTAPWAEHLGPYLRRTGRDRHVYLGPGPEPVVATLTWEPDGLPAGTGGDVVEVPRLDGRFRIVASGGS